MNKQFLYAAYSCIASFALAQQATAVPPPNLSPHAKIKTADEAVETVESSYIKASRGSYPYFKPSGVIGFESACDFPPFARKGQWCWEIDAYAGMYAAPRVIKVDSSMTLRPNKYPPGSIMWHMSNETLSETIMARVWVNAESGELLYVAGGTAEVPNRISAVGSLFMSGVNAIRQTPLTLNASQIGASRITDVAVRLFEQRFSLQLPKNRIMHMRNIALEFALDGFANGIEPFREIRFYENKGADAFVLTGDVKYTDMMEYERIFPQRKGLYPFAKEMSAIERRFHQNRGNLLGTVWVKKHGAEVRFYFPMPDPDPAPQSAGKPAAKPDTNPPAQKPAAQKPATAAPSAQKR